MSGKRNVREGRGKVQHVKLRDNVGTRRAMLQKSIASLGLAALGNIGFSKLVEAGASGSAETSKRSGDVKPLSPLKANGVREAAGDNPTAAGPRPEGDCCWLEMACENVCQAVCQNFCQAFPVCQATCQAGGGACQSGLCLNPPYGCQVGCQISCVLPCVATCEVICQEQGECGGGCGMVVQG